MQIQVYYHTIPLETKRTPAVLPKNMFYLNDTWFGISPKFLERDPSAIQPFFHTGK